MLEVNPILVKEIRSRMRGARAFVLLTVYMLILSGVTLLLYAAMESSVGTQLDAGRQIGKTLFLVIAAVALVEVCLITPALTSGSIAGERERQTYDLLIASLLSPWQIIWGKLASALAFALLLILAVVPVMSLAFLFGGVSLAEVLIALVGLVATALLYATIGIFWSAVMRSSLGATSFAIGTVIMLLLGIPFLIVIFMLLFSRDASSDLIESVFFIYASRLFMSIHPFIALGITEAALSSGGSPFIEIVSTGSAGIPIPSAWLMYVFMSLLFSLVLLTLSVRAIQPTQPVTLRQLQAQPAAEPPSDALDSPGA